MAVTNGDLIKVAVDILCPDSVIAQNVFYWLISDPNPDNPTNAQVVTAVDGLLSLMYAAILGKLSSAYDIDSFDIDRIDWETDKWVVQENIGGAQLDDPGTDTSDAVPHGVAAVLTAPTVKPKTRARKFIPGFAENQIEDSTLSGGLITDLTTFAARWLTDTTITGAAQLVPAVASLSGPSAGTIWTLVSVIVNSIAGYQRRRKPGVGS